MTSKRLFLALTFSLLGGFLLWSPERPANAQQAFQLTPEHVRQAFGTTPTPAEMARFKSFKVDMNGDGKHEIVLIENPNMVAPTQAPTPGGPQCPCPAGKQSPQEDKIADLLGSQKTALFQIELAKLKRRKHDLKIWLSVRKAAGTKFEQWTQETCRILGKKLNRLRKYRIRDIYFINRDDGQTTRISPSRCRNLSRTNKKKQKRMFKRWRREEANTTVPMCPCPVKKKKGRAPLPGPAKPLNIVVAAEEQPKNAVAPGGTPGGTVSAADLLPKLKVLGRVQGDSPRLVPLTQSGNIMGLRIEQTTQLGPRMPRTTMEKLYVYDEGNSGQLRQVFELKTSYEGDDNEPGARQWLDVKFQQMDSDEWLEITADAYYETPNFTGLLARRMFKWHEGKYVPLNTYRGILRAQSSSTWSRIAPRGASTLQRRLLMRTHPNNVIDGFRDTAWVAGTMKRGTGQWVRVDFMRNMELFGVAIAVETSTQFSPFVPNMFPSTPPSVISPTYVLIKTSAGFQQTTAVRSNGFTFVRFPTPIQTRYLHLTIATEHRDANRRTFRLNLPPKERALGLISEIVPIFTRVRYTASSFETKGTESMVPWQLGDQRSATAWAEGRSDDGIGEWAQMVFPMPRTLTQLTIVNGCRRPGEAYTLNNRIKDALLTFSNGSTQTVTLKDTHKAQTIRVNGTRTMSVKLTIQSIYKGKLGHTTCMAEFRP